VSTSLLAAGVWAAGVMVGGALAGAKQPAMHDRVHPANAGANVYRSADDHWFVLALQPTKVVNFLKAIGRADILSDPRFTDPANLQANMAELASIFDGIFVSRPMAHWAAVFADVQVTFGVVNGPEEVINDPQLAANSIVVPLEGGGKTISSPFVVHGVDKTPARRGPGLGEHTDEILRELGFDDKSIASFREAGAIPAGERAAA
jgi:formyl-CoA transferase